MLWLVTAGLAAYEILTAENKTAAAVREGASIGGGLAGAWARGQLGLFCGPWAWVCSPLGALIGGFAGAEGMADAADYVTDTVSEWYAEKEK